MKKLLTSLLCCTFFNSFAQYDDGMAHLRRYNFSMDACYSSFIPRLLLKPSLSVYLLDQGKLYINGNFGTEIAKVESYDINTGSIANMLASTGLSKKFGSREFSVGYNFVNHMNENATIRTSWSSGPLGNRSMGSRRVTTLIEPGSRRQILGGHIGFGTYRTQLFAHPIDVEYLDANKNIANLDLNNYYVIRTNNISQYGFIGLHLYSCGKPERRYENLYGGRVGNFSLDFIYVTNQYIAPVYNFLNEKYYLSSSTRKNWLGHGIRFASEGKGSGRAGIHTKYEIGFIPSPANPGGIYFSVNLGMHITPVKNLIIPQKDSY